MLKPGYCFVNSIAGICVGEMMLQMAVFDFSHQRMHGVEVVGADLCLGTSSLEGLLGTVLGVTLVTDKLGVHTAQRRVLVGLGLLDTVTVSLAHLVVLRRVL